METLQEYIDKAATLIEALPYIQTFRGKVVVVKYGGSTFKDGSDSDAETVLKDLVFMEIVGMKPVIVHGGGNAIDLRLREQGIVSERVRGLRVTDGAAMKVVEETLFGDVNGGLVEQINQLGGGAVGVSAKESEVMHVRKLQIEEEEVDLGFVGQVEHIDAAPLHDLIDQGMLPVVAPIGRGPEGASYNVNADTAAGEIAAALRAEKLVFLTDVKGIMEDPEKPESLLSTVHINDVDRLIEDGTIRGGMIPKTSACVKSVKAGVRKTHIIDGRIPHSMLLEFFTDEGIGTQIVQ